MVALFFSVNDVDRMNFAQRDGPSVVTYWWGKIPMTFLIGRCTVAISGKYGKIGIPIPFAEQLDEEIERFRSWGGPEKMPD